MKDGERRMKSAEGAPLRDASDVFGKAMALDIDAQMWYLGLEGHYRAHVNNRIRVGTRMAFAEARTWWIPKWLWNRKLQELRG